jgi:hypothetical protein
VLRLEKCLYPTLAFVGFFFHPKRKFVGRYTNVFLATWILYFIATASPTRRQYNVQKSVEEKKRT